MYAAAAAACALMQLCLIAVDKMSTHNTYCSQTHATRDVPLQLRSHHNLEAGRFVLFVE